MSGGSNNSTAAATPCTAAMRVINLRTVTASATSAGNGNINVGNPGRDCKVTATVESEKWENVIIQMP
jgi:hypothetical protein